jgi:hypothetical protein
LGQVSSKSGIDAPLIIKGRSAKDSLAILRKLQQQGFFMAKLTKQAEWKWLLQKGEQFFMVSTAESLNQQPDSFMQLQMDWLNGQIQKGYPFASFQLHADSSQGQHLFVSVFQQPGPYCTYDSIAGVGGGFSAYFLKKAGGIQVGLPYNDEQLVLFRKRMAAARGYALSDKALLSLRYGRFVVNPGIFRLQQDRISGLLGLATQAQQKPLITGEADLALYDLFGHGASITANWRRFQARSQELVATVEVPYALGLPFISGVNLSFEKYDTIYTRFRRGVLFRFPAGKNSRWSLGVDITGINALQQDTLTLLTQKRLPANASSKSTVYFLAFQRSRFSGSVFPVKGLILDVKAGIGSRIWVRDAAAASITWVNASGIRENIFDSLQRKGNLRQTTYRADYHLQVFVPVVKNFLLAASFMGQEYQAPSVSFSEISRWGGINSIRGFNEQRIFANSFHMANLEMRFMANQSGFIAPFVSVAAFRNDSKQGISNGKLLSSGVAAAIKTGAGVMKFAWAMGQENGSGFKLNNAKFHLGISNVF